MCLGVVFPAETFPWHKSSKLSKNKQIVRLHGAEEENGINSVVTISVFGLVIYPKIHSKIVETGQRLKTALRLDLIGWNESEQSF